MLYQSTCLKRVRNKSRSSLARILISFCAQMFPHFSFGKHISSVGIQKILVRPCDSQLESKKGMNTSQTIPLSIRATTFPIFSPITTALMVEANWSGAMMTQNTAILMRQAHCRNLSISAFFCRLWPYLITSGLIFQVSIGSLAMSSQLTEPVLPNHYFRVRTKASNLRSASHLATIT